MTIVEKIVKDLSDKYVGKEFKYRSPYGSISDWIDTVHSVFVIYTCTKDNKNKAEFYVKGTKCLGKRNGILEPGNVYELKRVKFLK